MEDMVAGKDKYSSQVARPELGFWNKKRVLLTGHSGFKGGWLSLWLSRMGARVSGISLVPDTTPNLFGLANIDKCTDSHFCDIRNARELAVLVAGIEPEIVIHMAAQALVRPGYKEPLETFETNVLGTANILEAVRNIDSVRVIVAVTTDKVYRNLEHAKPYCETDELGGYDPYSASKAASELVIASYRDSFLADNGVALASARAGNVIGGGDWSQERLIPDAIRAWGSKGNLHIRRPQAIRPWQHVLEPLNGYLILAEHLWRSPELAGPYNFGPETNQAATVSEVIELARKAFGDGDITLGEGSEGPHEAGYLSLQISRAKSVLGVHPTWDLKESVTRTMTWYRRQQQGEDASRLCGEDIDAYEART
jgi:CDP-glucose 4,6-dehydratase